MAPFIQSAPRQHGVCGAGRTHHGLHRAGTLDEVREQEDLGAGVLGQCLSVFGSSIDQQHRGAVLGKSPGATFGHGGDADHGHRAGSLCQTLADHGDRDLCQGHGVCQGEAPEVFRLNPDENKAELLVTSPDEGLRARVALAVQHCPTRALSIDSQPEE
jgi:ferredoxin